MPLNKLKNLLVPQDDIFFKLMEKQAETAGGVVLVQMASMGIPVSTTHAIAGSIMGVGSTQSPKSVRWGLSRNIVMAWFITIPFSAIVAGGTFFVLNYFL